VLLGLDSGVALGDEGLLMPEKVALLDRRNHLLGVVNPKKDRDGRDDESKNG